MSARRPLLTALGATTLLGALWFVPSANATAPGAAGGPSGVPAAANAASADSAAPAAGPRTQTGSQPVPLSLADTGSTDTTPYLLGGTVCLGIGAGFVTFSVRRSRAL
ncbi:LPXTG cell wall anchor domain-containing protein [Streptomyces sp. ISL-94]|uniref:LPXTG cell wall anchor domain-containing protein n=1 Tax=Streptomyces sp. ISL-94 TaxID=2819190 RepID=UPI001BE56141|nr:LPXTG cell wall anchor domain-containing protein [Streptomyces sp. ISL-94]MBT2480377.1 LPXTG cell wall anchor domain-containing protein [Streptomyces sp. ISL-94]